MTFAEFYDGCKRNRLSVGLDIDTIPEQPNGQKCFLPECEVHDPGERLERWPWSPLKHDPHAPMTGEPRTVTYLATVVDGSKFCCSGKLGASIKTEHASRQLERMVSALIKQGRVRVRDFPIR